VVQDKREDKNSVLGNLNNKHLWLAGISANESPCVVGKTGTDMFVRRFDSLPAYRLNSDNSQRETAIIQGQESLDRKNLKL
jgi:hypothetical protein